MSTFEHRKEWRGKSLADCSRAELLEALEAEHRNTIALRVERDRLEANAMQSGVNLWRTP